MKNAILSAALLALIGCGGSEAEEIPPASATAGAEHTSPMQPHAMHGHGQHGQGGAVATACPMMLSGAEMTVEEIEGGSAMTFTTASAGDVEDLRARVRGMAAMHEQHAGMGHGMMAGMPRAEVSVVELPNGARLELRATDPADVEQLRRHAAVHADHMRTRRTCPMMTAAEAA